MEADKNKEMDIADAIMEKPLCFQIGSRFFYLYPITLGKRYLISRIIETLEVNVDMLTLNPSMEALRVVHTHPKEVCRIIAYTSLRTKEEVFDESKVSKLVSLFGEKMDEEDMVSLLIYILNDIDHRDYFKILGISKEQDRMSRAQGAKEEDKNTLSFGGVSVYGSLIDFACERYKWTMDYVVWGISYINLQLLIADSVKTVYLTDEERRRCGVTNKRNTVSASDPNIIKKLMSEDWSK